MGRFARRRRSLSKEDFKRVFRDNHRSKDGGITVLCRKNESGLARLGLAISKKHLARAVDRNRVKRLIRESFRQHQLLIAGMDIVVMSQPGLARRSNRQIIHALTRHWQLIDKKAVKRTVIPGAIYRG